MNMIEVKVKKMFDDVQLPEYATPGSACFDIRAYITKDDNWDETRWFTDKAVFKTGLQFEVPDNHVMLVFSRSGHGFKNDVRLSNCVGVIDSDYRGELLVKLSKDDMHQTKHGGGQKTFAVKNGDRIAQGMIIPYEQVQFVLADKLSDTERGEGGFGSTDV